MSLRNQSRNGSLLLLLTAGLILAGAAPSLAAQPAKGKPAPHPAIRPVTTAEIAGWLCKGLAGDDPRKFAATFLDGKVKGEADETRWNASVSVKDELLFNVNLVGDPSIGAWYLALSLYGDWHGISEEDWSLLARRIPGRVLKADETRYVICRPTKEDCGNFAGFEAKPGARQLMMMWGDDPQHPQRPPAWFCPKG